MISARQRWTVAPRLPPEQLARRPGLHPLLVQLLDNRGLREPGDVELFLAGAAGWTGDPELLKGVPEAAARVERSIGARELIAVHGDFDADGMTAAAVLFETLRALGARVIPFIPQRGDGYGLHLRSLKQLAEQGVQLVVTADCGVSASAEVAAAGEWGLDVVVTDHHQITGPLPAAVAVVNPRQPGCPYPFKALAGVGVAFKLAQALLQRRLPVDGRSPEEVERSLLDLVAVGTIVDVVPLLGENRVLACRGLVELNRTERPGLRELVRVAGLTPGSIDAWHVAYTIGPRLNATGRLGDASPSYRLLVGDVGEAPSLALELEAANRERQQVMEETLARARQEVATQPPSAGLLLVAGPEYPHGIVGLVAGRLAEEYYRPALVVGIDGAEARGSARSIPGFDVAEALARCRPLLTRFGGHARAAGFTAPLANLAALETCLRAQADAALAGSDLTPVLDVDAELNLRGVTRRLYQEIQRLAPFGYGNPIPTFLSRHLRVLDARVVGQHAPGHLKLALSDGANRWRAIGFGLGGLASNLPPVVDAVYQLSADRWSGQPALELRILALQPSDGGLLTS